MYIENEVTSEVMSMARDSVLVRILSTGEVRPVGSVHSSTLCHKVHYHYRVRTNVLCEMELHRFPHDTQDCHISLESWSHSVRDLLLTWERPEKVRQL